MDNPLLAGLMVFMAVFAVGSFFDRWSWAKPLFAIGVIALIIESVVMFVR